MNTWTIEKNFNETLLPKKEGFYSNLNMEDIKDSDHNHAKRFCKDFEINVLRNLCAIPSKISFSSSIRMLLMVGKGIRREICHAIHRYAKANKSYLSQELPVNGFKRVEDLSEFQKA